MQPKRRFSFFFLCLLLSCLPFATKASGALARSLLQEATPSATLEPLFKTPTNLPVLNTECPLVTPYGYGTVTPNVLWSAQCEHCMQTLEPLASSTPYPVNTYFVPVTQTVIAQTQAACQTVSPGGEACNTLTPGPSVTPSGVPTSNGYYYCYQATGTAIMTQTVGAPTPTPGGVTKVQDSSFSWIGSWTTETGSGNCDVPTSGTCRYTSSAGASWEKSLVFDGQNPVNIYGLRCTNQGKWYLKVDGQTVQTVDNYGSCTWRYLLASYTPSAGTHIISGVNSGAKNGSSSGYFTEFDYLSYTGAYSPPPTITPYATSSVAISCPAPAGNTAHCAQWDANTLLFTAAHGTTDADYLDYAGPAGTTFHFQIEAINSEICGNGSSLTFGNSGGGAYYDVPDHYVSANCRGLDDGLWSFNLGADAQTYFKFAGGMSGATWHLGQSRIFMTTLPCVNEPTPEPGGTPGAPGSNYCDVVPDAFGIPDNWGDLPSINLGAAQCASLGPFSINLSAINWLPGMSGIEEVGLPEISICLREIYFGTITIFGMSFDLDILSAVVTCVIALRWVFRS